MLPNFIIIGAQKAGTTSLYYYLKEHPEIFMSANKEPSFFGEWSEKGDEYSKIKFSMRNIVFTARDYETQFDKVENEKAIGEASPLYLFSKKAAQQISKKIPDCKIIVILRNPVNRTLSEYLNLYRDGHETLSFDQVINKELESISLGEDQRFYCLQKGLYFEQIKRYLNYFDKSQILICLYDDLEKSPKKLVQEIFKFLEVDSKFEPNMKVYNISGIPKNKVLARFFNRLVSLKNLSILREFVYKQYWITAFMMKVYLDLKHYYFAKNLQKPSISKETKKKLQNFFRSDVEKLAKLLDRDLSGWIRN